MVPTCLGSRKIDNPGAYKVALSSQEVVAELQPISPNGV